MRLRVGGIALALALAACDPSSQPEPEPEPEPEAEATHEATPTSGAYDPAMAAACSQACAVQFEYDEADVVAQPGAEAGDLAHCPVSSVVFVVREDSPTVTHAGRTWFTCCEGCAEKLREDPSRVLGAS